MALRSWLIAMVVLASGCASLPPPIPNELQLMKAQQSKPDVTMASLQQGRTLFLGRCGSCHAPPAPSERSAQAWRGEVQEIELGFVAWQR